MLVRTLLWGLLCGLLLTGCESSKIPLRVGTNLWPGYAPLYLARNEGYFHSDNIRLVELLSTSEVLRSFRNGTLDVAALTLDEALLLADSGIPISVLLVADSSNGADVILARDAKDMQSLAGKRIGVETTALGAYVLSRALSLNGMRADQLTIVPLEANQHEKAFRDGRVDAVVTFEPVRSHLLASGAYQVFDSSQIPDEIIDVLVVRKGSEVTHKSQLRQLIQGWYRALDDIHRHPKHAYAVMAPRIGLTSEQLRHAVQELDIPGPEKNRQLMYGTKHTLSDLAHRLNKVMFEQKLIRRQVDLSHLTVTPELYP